MKILAIQLKRIGDLILTAPALYVLRKSFPQAEITLILGEKCRELMPAIDSVDKHLIYQRSGNNYKLWKKLLFSHYDVCLDFTGNDRSAFISVLSKAEKRVAFKWVKKSPVRAMFYNDLVDSSVRENHTVDHYVDLLRGVGIQNGQSGAHLKLPEWAFKKARQHLQEFGIEGPYAVVHPGASRPEKYWMPERWAAVVEHCRKKLGVECILTGVSDQMEALHLEEVLEQLAEPCPSLAGRVDLLTLGALIQNARFFLGVDSAPMHLAAAFDTPQVALFGPTNPYHWRPRNQHCTIVLAGQSEPVAEFTEYHAAAPLSEVSTEQVIRAMDRAFSAELQQPR